MGQEGLKSADICLITNQGKYYPREKFLHIARCFLAYFTLWHLDKTNFFKTDRHMKIA